MKVPFDPIYVRSSLIRWYETNRRILPWRETNNPYFIWVSEIILQQTRVAQGMEYYLRFIDRFPDVQSLAEASEDEVLRYWQGLGYYSRARNLHKAARMIAGGVFPSTYEALRRLPGVGDYTAGAIASFAYNLPYPAIDGNVIRVLSRLYDFDAAFDSTDGKKQFIRLAEELMDKSRPALFNSAVMELGALCCTPQSPDCEHCPVQAVCEAHRHHTECLLPVRKAKPVLRDRYLNYIIFLASSGETADAVTLLHRRTGNDIWKHLYEFPLVEAEKPLSPEETLHVFGLPADAFQITTTMQTTHILSHQRLHARFTLCHTECLPALPDMQTVPFNCLGDYALSRLTDKALQRLIGR